MKEYAIFILGNIDIGINILFWMFVIAQLTRSGKEDYHKPILFMVALVILWPSKELWIKIING